MDEDSLPAERARLSDLDALIHHSHGELAEELKRMRNSLVAALEHNLTMLVLDSAPMLLTKLQSCNSSSCSATQSRVDKAIAEINDAVSLFRLDDLGNKTRRLLDEDDEDLDKKSTTEDAQERLHARVYIDSIGRSFAWPLPFGLDLPTEEMLQLAQSIKARMELSLKGSVKSTNDSMTKRLRDLEEHRDSLAQLLPGLRRELNRAREKYERAKAEQARQEEAARQEAERKEQERKKREAEERNSAKKKKESDAKKKTLPLRQGCTKKNNELSKPCCRPARDVHGDLFGRSRCSFLICIPSMGLVR